MDVHPHENGTTTLERVQQREELRAIVADVHQLPKTQRTALILRAIDDLSYTDIAQAMGTTLPSVKSLLTRARTSLAESSAGRAALAPLGLLALLRKLIPAKLGGSGAGGTAGVAASAGSAGGAAGTAGDVVSTAATGIGGALGRQGRRGRGERRPDHGRSRERRRGESAIASMPRRGGGARVSAATGAEDGFGLPAASRRLGRRGRRRTPPRRAGLEAGPPPVQGGLGNRPAARPAGAARRPPGRARRPPQKSRPSAAATCPRGRARRRVGAPAGGPSRQPRPRRHACVR